jgi:hypothetical protein
MPEQALSGISRGIDDAKHGAQHQLSVQLGFRWGELIRL